MERSRMRRGRIRTALRMGSKLSIRGSGIGWQSVRSLRGSGTGLRSQGERSSEVICGSQEYRGMFIGCILVEGSIKPDSQIALVLKVTVSQATGAHPRREISTEDGVEIMRKS